MNYYGIIFSIFITKMAFGIEYNHSLKMKTFKNFSWDKKNRLCKKLENQIGQEIIYFPTAMDDLSYSDYRSRDEPWSKLNNAVKKAWCHITENEHERAFFLLPEQYKTKFCNDFKKKHNIKIYDDIASTIGTHHLPWGRLSYEKKIEHCKYVARVKDPNNPFIKKIEAIAKKNREEILAGAKKRFDERRKILKAKEMAIKREFYSRVSSIKEKEQHFDNRLSARKKDFVVKSTEHLNSFSNLKKKDKMRQVYDSFVYTFSNGLVGKKKDCTITPICDESISIKDKFLNSVKILFEGDEDKKNITKNKISQDAKKHIEILNNL